MLNNQAKRLALALFLFLTFAPTAQACFGCFSSIEEQIYFEGPIIYFISFLFPLYLGIRFSSWLICCPKSYADNSTNLTRMLNCTILSYYTYAAASFIEAVFPKHFPFFRVVSPLFFNPLVLTIVACLTLKNCKWANKVFASFWCCIFPFAIAFITSTFDGSRYRLWDAERTVGLLLFAFMLLGAWLAIPAHFRPFWSRKRQVVTVAKAVRGLHLAKAVFHSPDGTCGLCGEAIGHDYVTCSECATPMHKECWEWNERTCVVYGCQSRRLKAKRRIKALGRRRKLALATGD